MAKTDLFDTAEGEEIERVLEQMAADASYHTGSSYTPNTEQYTNHKMTFVEKHKRYLRSHPTTNPQHYIANLRLMTRKKVSN